MQVAPAKLTRLLRNSLVLSCGPLLFLSGCHKTPRVDFATVPVTSIDVRLASDAAIGPGQKKSLVVTLATPDGTVWRTSGSPHKVAWSDLSLTSSVVDVTAKGQVSLIRDPTQIMGDFAHVEVAVPSHPQLRGELDIPLRYDLHYFQDFSGSRGIDGTNGINGSDGMRGSDGIIDVQGKQGAGGNGSDGADGTSGTDGGPGGSGADVEIYLVPQPGNQRRIQASVSADGGRPTFFLIDPNGGSLTVRSDGGQGGSGGKGGRGGRGGDGGSGSPSGLRGRDGLNGRDGLEGSHGWGGRITVVYDPDVQPYLKVLHLSSAWGPGPAYISRPLQPLW